MSAAYLLGACHHKLGYSVSYNPFRHKGTANEYNDWVKGWNNL